MQYSQSVGLAALAALNHARPAQRKILVAPDINWGREMLFALAWRTGGWVGWEPATLKSLAEDLAFAELGASGRRVAGDVELTTLIDEALADAVASGAVGPAFAALAGGLGFRKAVRDAVLELRTAGIASDTVRQASDAGSPARDVASVLDRYERRLTTLGLVDPAALFTIALAAFDREAPFTLTGTIVLAPDLRSAGLPGALIARLLDLGARPFADDLPEGLTVPPRMVEAVAQARGVESWPGSAGSAPPAAPDLFAASTPTDEIREVLRRAASEGRRWDEIEIAASDVDSYGVALDAVCTRAGIPYTSLQGVPLACTRVGRAVERWLGWIGDGLPVDMIREALEAGDLALPASDVAPGALARRLRRLGIGWGRARYEAAHRRLLRGDDPPAMLDDETPEAHAERLERHARSGAALAQLIESLLRVTPPVPERGNPTPVRTCAAALARATIGWLDLLPLHGETENRTAARLRSRLEALAKTDGATVSFGTALAELRDALSDLRAWTAASAGRKPWSTSGGALHLTDLAHGGTTGRARTFVVGLDADRVAGARVQDPILNDAARHAIDAAALPVTAIRRAERAWMLARTLARLRGKVTLSYAIAGDAGDRAVGPAHVLLEAFRRAEGNPDLDYDALRRHLGTPVCPVPGTRDDALDSREVWLAAIADGAVLLDAQIPVRAHYRLLDTGLIGLVARADGRPSAHHGLVTAAAGVLDPRASTRPISASSLEKLAACPLAWFYNYGLRLRPPDDPAYDAERWLDTMQRGSLLHALYERMCTDYVGRQTALLEPSAREHVLALLDTLIEEWRVEVPPPSEAVFTTETEELRAAALAFLEGEREAVVKGDFGVWEAFEVKFGADAPVSLTVGSGQLPVKGSIDRVDRLADGRLLVIDYKTGSTYPYENRDGGPFKGGRHLQAAVYAAAARARLGGTVAAFEYRFPTPKGENRTVRYVAADFVRATDIIGGLLDHVVKGHFVPTNEADDCKYCDFAVICRVRSEQWELTSPRAEWAAEFGEGLPEYAGMLRRRSDD